MKKFTSIDYLRALSMVYIVGYWHLFDYADASLGHDVVAMNLLTHTVLAIFVFISGFLLGGDSTRKMSAGQFYLRRLLRIYPLYALAVIVFYLAGINDGWTSVKALLGVSMYLAPAPLTLWFITMLVLFYFVAPVLLMLVDRVAAYIRFVFSLFVGTIIVMLAFDTVDPRAVLYFPSFCLGIFCANHGVKNRLVNPLLAGAVFVVCAPLILITFAIETLNYLKQIPLVASGAYLVFYLCWRKEQRFTRSIVVSFLAYSSYAIYLFHRPVFNSLQAIYFPETEVFQILYLLTLGFTLAALIAWCLQKSYDVVYRRIMTKGVATAAFDRRAASAPAARADYSQPLRLKNR